MENGFKTGLDITLEKGTDIKQKVKASSAFKNIESIFKQPEVDSTIAITQEKSEAVKAVATIKADKPDLDKSGIFKGNTSSTTTTPKMNQEKPKVKLHRLSNFSIKILEILRDCGAVTNHDFCNKLNTKNNYLKQYLYRLQRYGFIFRDNTNWKWYLCDLDNDFFVDLDHILYYIYKGNTKVTQKEHKSNTIYKVNNVLPLNKNKEILTEEKNTKQETQKLLRTKQLNLAEFFQRAQQDQIDGVVVELSQIENKILMNLASWYDKTQAEATARPYKRYESDYAFAEEVGHSLQEVKLALAKLDDCGYVYTLPPKQDKYGMWKIGFTEDFLEKVKNR